MKSLIITFALLLLTSIPLLSLEDTILSFPVKKTFAITAFDENDLILYIGTNYGLITVNKYNHKINYLTEKKSLLPSDQVTSIACTRDDKVYIGTPNGILVRDKTGYHPFTSENSNLPDQHITALAIDPADHLWIGTKNDGLLISTDASNQYFVTQPIEFNNESIYSITFDRLGCAWVVFQQGGLACLSNGQWYTYPASQPIENITIKNSGKFLLHTPQCTYLSEGTSFKKIPIESIEANITCAYYDPKYSKPLICYDDGIYVIDTVHHISIPEIIPYLTLVHSINDYCHTKKTKPIGQAILDAFNAHLD